MEARHLTLEADTVATVTFSEDATQVEVLSRDGAAEVYFTISGPRGQAPADPAVEGDDTYVCPAAIGSVVSGSAGVRAPTVKLIAHVATAVSVTATSLTEQVK